MQARWGSLVVSCDFRILLILFLIVSSRIWWILVARPLYLPDCPERISWIQSLSMPGDAVKMVHILYFHVLSMFPSELRESRKFRYWFWTQRWGHRACINTFFFEMGGLCNLLAPLLFAGCIEPMGVGFSPNGRLLAVPLECAFG